jgi:hypothetical protein
MPARRPMPGPGLKRTSPAPALNGHRFTGPWNSKESFCGNISVSTAGPMYRAPGALQKNDQLLCNRLMPGVPERPGGIDLIWTSLVPRIHVPATAHLIHPEPFDIAFRYPVLHQGGNIVIDVDQPQWPVFFRPLRTLTVKMLPQTLHQVLREPDIIIIALQFQHIHCPDGMFGHGPFQAPADIPSDDTLDPPDKVQRAAMLTAMQALIGFQLWQRPTKSSPIAFR